MSIPFELTTAFATAAVATSIAALLSNSILPTLLEQKDRREKKRTKLKEQISDEELQSLLLELRTKGIVSIAGTKVSYELPA